MKLCTQAHGLEQHRSPSTIEDAPGTLEQEGWGPPQPGRAGEELKAGPKGSTPSRSAQGKEQGDPASGADGIQVPFLTVLL